MVSFLLFTGNIKPADAEHELSGAYRSEPGLTQHGHELVGQRELENGVGQICECSRVAGHSGSYAGQYLERVELVEAEYEPVLGVGELQNDEFAARLEHTLHLAQAFHQVLKVTDAEGHTHAVKRAVGKTQILGIAYLKVYGQSLALGLSNLQHTL